VLRLKWLNGFFTRRGQQPESKIDRWNTLRYCVPLDRLTVTGVGDYHGFATLVSLQVALDKPRKTILPMDVGMPTLPDSHPAIDTDLTFNFNVAVISNQTFFIEQLHSGLRLAHQRRLKAGVPTPSMSFSVAGLDFLAEDADYTEGRPESIHAKLARKAERAHLAAKAFGLQEEEGMWREFA
jgi:sterol 3beta-glucosyltransferase